MKDKKVEERVQRLIEKSRLAGPPIKKKVSTQRRSSLGQIIKTKDQADALMAALKSLQE